MKGLSTYIARACGRPMPKAFVEKTKHHVLDTIAAMVSGSRLHAGEMAIKYVKTLGGTKQATVIGSRFVTNTVNAAFANAMLAHADETDDSHAKAYMHPGSGIVPAALAVAEQWRCSGTALLRAVALGYDVGARLNLSLGGGEMIKLGHTMHSFGNHFGAAAAGAALAKLDARQVRHVLSYTAQQCSGVSTYARDLDHTEKAFDFSGMAARNGISAVTMVAAGCTGVDDVFSGERNFHRAYDESARHGIKPQPELLTEDLGSNYELMGTNIKRWSVGSPIQGALDLLYDLIRSDNIKAADVEKVVARVYAGGARTTDNREMPDINIQHMCALMLVDGNVTFDSAHDVKRMKDPRVLALRKRVELVADEEYERLRPVKHYAVDLTLKDGRVLHKHTDAVRGTTQNPMTRQEVEDKCFGLMASILGKKRAKALCEAVWNIEDIKDIRKLRPLLQA